ncbi:MAG: glycosyltransferase family 1 protein, partial [Flavobacterium sp.]
MKIAFLTPEFPHPKIGATGGIGTSISNLAAGLAKGGHAVSILVYGQSDDEVFEDSGLTFYRIKNIKFKGLSWYLTRKKIEKLLNKLHRENKVDVAEAPDWVGISSFINANCPLVVRLHGSDTYFCHLDNRPVNWSSRFHEKRALKKADALLSVSRYTADVTNELFGLNRNFTVIPNGVDTEKFQPTDVAQSNDILYFGTLIRKKGLLELPHIFNEVHKSNPSAKLLLVGRDAPDIISGNPSTWEMMKPLFSADAFANVSYLGGVPYDEIRKHIESAAVCVFPTFAEALPVSWIEAMAMRKPLVASNIGWASEVIEDGKSGFLEHPKN